jgi:hypothetical protein
VTPDINGATLAQAYQTGPAADPAADERSAGTAALAQQARDPAPGQTIAVAGEPAGSHARGVPSFNLESLAAAVGLDPDELLNQVKSGRGISDLLGRAGQTGYGSTVRDALRGGILIDEYV